jgi:hypothetical protein
MHSTALPGPHVLYAILAPFHVINLSTFFHYVLLHGSGKKRPILE